MRVNQIVIKGGIFAYTGRMWTTCERIIELVKLVGGEYSSIVTSYIDGLVVGTMRELTKKYLKAQAVGIPIINSFEFKRVLDRDLGSYGIVSTPKSVQINPKKITDKFKEYSKYSVSKQGMFCDFPYRTEMVLGECVGSNKDGTVSLLDRSTHPGPVIGIVRDIDHDKGLVTVELSNVTQIDFDPKVKLDPIIYDDVDGQLLTEESPKPLTKRQKTLLKNTMTKIGEELDEIDDLLANDPDKSK